MNLLSRLPRGNLDHRSLRWHDSKTVPGVRYATRQVSLSQRIELTQRVRELSLKHEFLRAGDVSDHLESSLSDLYAKKVYIEWALADLKGLSIDRVKATPASLIEMGPERLSTEIVETIRGEISLSEDEIKNF